jgi:hypothetical protein
VILGLLVEALVLVEIEAVVRALAVSVIASALHHDRPAMTQSTASAPKRTTPKYIA